MIERIGEIGAVSIAAPSAGHGAARRQKRLKWLSSLREALDEAGPLIEELGDGGADREIVADTRARIADALALVAELRGRLGGGEDVTAAAGDDRMITAADLGRRIAGGGDRSLRAQARISPATVRRLVDGSSEPGVKTFRPWSF